MSRSSRNLPSPRLARWAVSQVLRIKDQEAFVPELDEEACTPCSRCADRCPVNAIEVDEANASVFMDHDDCIGCGVCVTPCKQEAISLTQRPAAA